MYRQDIIQCPSIEITFAKFLKFKLVKFFISVFAPAPAQGGGPPQSRHGTHERFHDFSRQECIPVMLRLQQKIPQRLGIAGPVWRKYGIGWKALERSIIPKHVLEKSSSFFNLLAFCGLVIDDAYPRTDARQCPYILPLVEF